MSERTPRHRLGFAISLALHPAGVGADLSFRPSRCACKRRWASNCRSAPLMPGSAGAPPASARQTRTSANTGPEPTPEPEPEPVAPPPAPPVKAAPAPRRPWCKAPTAVGAPGYRFQAKESKPEPKKNKPEEKAGTEKKCRAQNPNRRNRAKPEPKKPEPETRAKEIRSLKPEPKKSEPCRSRNRNQESEAQARTEKPGALSLSKTGT